MLGVTLRLTIASHPVGVEILLVGLCCRNRVKLTHDGQRGSYADFAFTYLLTFTVSAITPWIARTFSEVMQLVKVKGTAVYNLYIHVVFTCGISFSCAHSHSHLAFTEEWMVILQVQTDHCSTGALGRSILGSKGIPCVSGHFVPIMPFVLEVLGVAFVCGVLVCLRAITIVQIFVIVNFARIACRYETNQT